MSDAPSGKLKEQDLTNLDITKLTPSSPQVISRQATINIDSMNENPQSPSYAITSKKRNHSDSNVDCSKVYSNSESNLDKIDAALLDFENSLKENVNSVNSTQHTKQLTPKKDNRTDDKLLSFTNKSPYLKFKSKSSKNSKYSSTNAEELQTSDVIQYSRSKPNTATITLPNIVEGHHKFMNTNSMIKSFILDGKMIDLLIDPKNLDSFLKEEEIDPNVIDEIVDDEVIHGVYFYLVKWKNWSRGFNTWERSITLIEKAQRHIINFGIKKSQKNSLKVAGKSVNGLHVMLSKQTICKLFDCCRNENGISLPIVNVDDLVGLLHSRNVDGFNRDQSLFMNFAVIALDFFRSQQLSVFKQYENDVSMLGSNRYLVGIENNVDLEGPLKEIKYTPECIFTDDIVPEDPPIGCNCKKNCLDSGFCCNDMAGYPAAYDANKHVIVPPGHPIFECNKKCKCTEKCSNRVVQLGSQIKVCVYKIKSTNSWGVRTKQNIMKGQFVSEYVGEVITTEKADERLENKYSTLEHMWNLDFNDTEDYKYIIDSSHFSNFTYYLNHSCVPNLNLYAVWVNCLDLNLPHLALFASRDILAGEQLTINYFSRDSGQDLRKTGIKCQCNMKNCRDKVFLNEN